MCDLVQKGLHGNFVIDASNLLDNFNTQILRLLNSNIEGVRGEHSDGEGLTNSKFSHSFGLLSFFTHVNSSLSRREFSNWQDIPTLRIKLKTSSEQGIFALPLGFAIHLDIALGRSLSSFKDFFTLAFTISLIHSLSLGPRLCGASSFATTSKGGSRIGLRMLSTLFFWL